MSRAELRWPPHPYRAGFTITDDTDASRLPTVRAVYDVLAAHRVRVTRTVWAFAPEEPCGIPPLPARMQRGVTLEDAAYLRYCEQLGEQGFEIALHGASAGNNRRARTERAFARLDRHFPRSWTYICHAKNAENPYWQEKTVARGPLRVPSRWFGRAHACSGEDPASPYFWGDLCRERVRYIRLFRTREPDVLAANPSMPYFEREKPYVRGWFSACKRSFARVTELDVLAALERDWGLCVLYQYLDRWADPATGVARPEFVAGVRRLAGRPRLWCDTATRLLDRLRLLHGVLLAARGQTLWLVNTNAAPVEALQVETAARPARAEPGVFVEPGVVVVAALAAGEMRALEMDRAVAPRGRTAIALDPDGRGRLAFGHGTVYLNTGAAPWRSDGLELSPRAYVVRFLPGLEAVAPRSRATDDELSRLWLGQAAIVGRELLLRGRKLDVDRWLAAPRVALEDHDAWE